MDEKLLKFSEGAEATDRMKSRVKHHTSPRKKLVPLEDLPFPWKAILLSVGIVFAVWSFLEITLGLYFYNN